MNDRDLEERQQKNRPNQTDPTSSRNWQHLTYEQSKTRQRKITVETQRTKRAINRLRSKLEEQDELMQQSVPFGFPTSDKKDLKKSVISDLSTKFKGEMKDKMQHTVDNFNDTYRQMIKEHVLHLLQHRVENEMKKNDYNFKPEDVNKMVNFVAENLQN